MRVYLDGTVVDAAKKRIKWCFDRFDEVVVNVSGGKDSGTLFNLAYDVATEIDELPIYCFWIDQEAEYAATEEMVESWMTRDGVEPLWLQVPMKMTNATSDDNSFLNVWGEDVDQWVRDKHPLSIKENTYGADRFDDLFEEVLVQEVVEENDTAKTVALSGIRTAESPNRYMGLTGANTYKGITYGKKKANDRNLWTIYPIYDWRYMDVWKYIHDNDLPYNDVYDYQFKEGKHINYMRVSNLNHETAVDNLFTLKQYEPDTYNRLVQRLDGIHAATQVGIDDYFPEELPWMFRDWREYRNFLLEKLVDDEEHYRGFQKRFFNHDIRAEHSENYEGILVQHVRGILANDWEGESVINNVGRDINDYNTPGWRKMRDKKLNYLEDEGILDKLREQGIVTGEI